ncbi:ABC-F family ATP-binding cassette domain-containing protein [Actinokineospora guangxiensis]|uniref:ABC-F family ATP-binding cassette domain-containing protein n=1 Tax=Actinokineospora guangxiensis TaxID=1490288 RepID=A0ABW0EM50_9PSEU
MGFLEASGLACTLPDGRTLFGDVAIRASAGQVVAVVGENGAGKTTLLRMLSGDLPADGVTVRGGLAVMPQFIGSVRDERTVRDVLLAVAPPALRSAAAELDAVELALMEADDEPTQMRYASALIAYEEAGGYDAEVLWDTVTVAAMGRPWDTARLREVRTLSGGEQKRLVLEVLLRGREQVLLLDEPDNYLDVPGKRWLEARLAETDKAVVLISHDRELLDAVATHVVTVEAGTAWTHAGRFAGWAQARQARWERVEEQRRRWDEEHEKLKELVRSLQRAATMSDGMASRYRAAQTRLRKFEEAGPPPVPPRPQRVVPRLRGGRTGVRALTCERLELSGLMRPFDLELFLGDRVAVLGANGSGKSHFLRLLAGDTVAHTGVFRLGARVRPGLFAQTHHHPEWLGRTLADILWHGDGDRAGLDRGAAAGVLSRYGLAAAGDQRFETLSGGQQARFQVLLLELTGATMLLLDEPTDNLDLHSAEALQDALEAYEGTVVSVTHDRWFAKSFDRYLVFCSDGSVVEHAAPVWDETRVKR